MSDFYVVVEGGLARVIVNGKADDSVLILDWDIVDDGDVEDVRTILADVKAQIPDSDPEKAGIMETITDKLEWLVRSEHADDLHNESVDDCPECALRPVLA